MSKAAKNPIPSSLEIHLLGPFRVVVDGQAIEERRWSRRKPALLVKLLALQPHHQLHREQVMEFLWPNLAQEAAANSLHKSIHAARRALEPALESGSDSHFILAHGHQVQLRAPEKLWIDVDAFESGAAKALKSSDAEAYEQALMLYEGDLLIEDPYDDWTTTQREHLRALRQDLLIKLSRLYESEGQHQQSVERLKQIVDLDPSNEAAHRQLMRLYALTGNRQQALHQYQQCCEDLRRELEAKPEQKRLAKQHTVSTTAYHHYLKGRYFWYKRTEEALRKGIEYFNQAIEEDPSYAAAYDGLSDSYALLALRGVIPPKEALLKAKAAAKKALEIDDSLAEAYASLAHVRLHDWDWSGLEEEFKHALKLNPGHSMAYHWYSEYLTAMGRVEESIAIMKEAQKIDPLSPISSIGLATRLQFARRYDQAIEQLQEGLEVTPNHFSLHFNLGLAYVQTERYEMAIEEMKKAVALSGRSTEALTGLGQAYAAAGLREDLQKVLDELDEQSGEHLRHEICRGVSGKFLGRVGEV